MARILASSEPVFDPLVRSELMNRISPVGQVRTSAEETVVEVAAAPQSAEQIVQGVCAGCHAAGVANAPKLDDVAAWEERRALGLDALLASVINGKGAMPARAGTTLNDEELRIAVAHMAGIEIEGSDAAASEAAAEDTSTAAVAESDATESTDADAVGGAESTTTEDSAAASATEDNSVAAAPSARVKGITDTVCAACHIAGVAGAPKIGDKEAWAERAEKGLEAQVAVVVAGKGAMPARGGSDLSDEELASAISYMVSQ